MPTWVDLDIRSGGNLVQGGTIIGLDRHERKKEDLLRGIFPREQMPPYIDVWPKDYKHHYVQGTPQAGPGPSGRGE